MTHLKSRKGYNHLNNGVTHTGIFKANSEGRRHTEERQCFWVNRVCRIMHEKRKEIKMGAVWESRMNFKRS